MDLVLIFFFLGSFTLLRLVWSDVKEFKVDERLSYYMFGATGVIFLAMDLILVWLVLTIVTGFVWVYIKEKPFMKKQVLLGNGDITIISWVVPSLFVLNWMWGVAFVFIYAIALFTVFSIIKKSYLPGTIPICIGFLGTWFVQLAHLI